MKTDLYIILCIFLHAVLFYSVVTLRNAWSRLHYRDRASERGRLLATLLPGLIGAGLLAPGIIGAVSAAASDPVSLPTWLIVAAGALIFGQAGLAFWVDTVTWFNAWNPRSARRGTAGQ